MAVAHETATESHTGTAGSASEASFDISVPFTSSSKGLLVYTFVIGATGDLATSVKIDPAGANTDVPALSGGRATDSAGEIGDCKAWFLGSGLPTTTATVRINRTNNASVMYAVAITVTASGNTETTGIVLLEEEGAITEQSVDDGSPGSNSVRYAGLYSGLTDVGTSIVGANSTSLHFIDVGPRGAHVVRETTAGQGARSVGFTAGTDDRAAVHLAIREGGGTAHTANPDDDEGLLDSASQVTDSVRSEDDAEGLLDAATGVTDSVRSQTDALGLVDSFVQLLSSEVTKTDPLGLVDSASQVATYEVTITDSLGLLDDGTWTAIGPDPLGITDGILVEQVHDRTQTDPLGLVDDATYQHDVGGVNHTATITDPLGLADSAVHVTDSVRNPTDPLGLLDNVTYEATGGTSHTATITDGLGLLDTATPAASYTRTHTDPLGLVDSRTVEIGLFATITDNLGLLDSSSYVMAFGPTVTDTLGLLDSQTQAGDVVREITDPEGLLDSISSQLVGSTFWTPNPAGYTSNPVAYVPVGPDDTPPW